ncbi:hypothetical protein T484DRAFT_1929086 [Baffinella frigidus]|nr:hypothetical protein T484DRAFT_1929086 [Cryptophyta sp. CCMP2293]
MAALAALLRASLASLATVGFVITLIVPTAAARLPAPGWCSAQNDPRAAALLRGSFHGSSRLLRLSGGCGAKGETPTKVEVLDVDPLVAAKEGLAHMEKEDWEQAVASFTSGLEADCDQAEFKVALYFNRAKARMWVGAWVEAGKDARCGLALCDGLEPDSTTVRELKPLLERIAIDAEGVPVADADIEAMEAGGE